MDLEFGDTVVGRFVDRPNRFVTRVTVDGRVALARLANSGRLRDTLVPGARVLLRPARRGGQQRATEFDLVAADVEETGVLACLDAQSTPKVLASAMARGVVPALAGYSVVRGEPGLGSGRADLLLRAPDGRCVPCECKSVTLVRRGAALFPDAPTSRGTRHVREISRAGGVLAFVVLRPDGGRVRANEPVDPAFAAELRSAVRSGLVTVACLVCDVTTRGVSVTQSVGLEWFDRRDIPPSLPDYVAPEMKLLVVGLNPGLYSAWYGMYFARPSNLFWDAIHRSGLIPEKVGPGDEAYLLKRYGIGFTDLVKRPTAGWHHVSRGEKREGAARLLELVHRLRPRKVCFVGISGAREVLGGNAGPGPWPYRLGGATQVYVLPSTSPRQVAFSRTEVFRWFQDMARWCTGGG